MNRIIEKLNKIFKSKFEIFTEIDKDEWHRVGYGNNMDIKYNSEYTIIFELIEWTPIGWDTGRDKIDPISSICKYMVIPDKSIRPKYKFIKDEIEMILIGNVIFSVGINNRFEIESDEILIRLGGVKE